VAPTVSQMDHRGSLGKLPEGNCIYFSEWRAPPRFGKVVLLRLKLPQLFEWFCPGRIAEVFAFMGEQRFQGPQTNWYFRRFTHP